MPKFSYTGRDRSGKTVSAEVDAPSRREALRIATSRGLQVSAVTEVAGAGAKAAAKPDKLAAPARSIRAEAPKRAECLPFLEALYELLSSGLSAGEAVRLLSIRVKEPRLRTLSAGLWEQISEGAALWRAMSGFPEVFDSSVTNLIQAGEATGSINDTVKRLIDHLTEQRELRQQLLMALAYPVFMVCVAFGVVLFFLFFLLPRLQGLLTSLGGKLPVSTALLIGAANFALDYGLIIVIAFLLLSGSFWRWRKTELGKAKTDAWLLKLPLIGQFLVARTVLAFSQTLSVLLENGITAAEALRMTERQIDNRVHRDAFNTATARVLEGEALSAALTRTGCFPDLVLDRLSVGENTGNLVPSLKQVAVGYQRLISSQLNIFTKVIASTVLMSVFILVGFIAFAIVSAVFQVSASIQVRR